MAGNRREPREEIIEHRRTYVEEISPPSRICLRTGANILKEQGRMSLRQIWLLGSLAVHSQQCPGYLGELVVKGPAVEFYWNSYEAARYNAIITVCPMEMVLWIGSAV